MVRDLVTCDRAFTTDFLDDDPVYLTGAGGDVSPDGASGEWIGLLKLSEAGAKLVGDELDAMGADGSLGQAEIPDFLNRLIAGGHKVQVQYITGQWLDIDDALDLARARNIL
ncbi:MAG: phosphoenolpyruvate phosphomutase [Alphaproteobacteria bacterium]